MWIEIEKKSMTVSIKYEIFLWVNVVKHIVEEIQIFQDGGRNYILKKITLK